MKKLRLKKVGIVANDRKPRARELQSKLAKWLLRRGIEVLQDHQSPVREIIRDSSLIVCLGGDGTLLSVAGHMKSRSVPVLGVNLGSLGFLTEIKEHEMIEEILRVLQGRGRIENRMMVRADILRKKGGLYRRFVALNDVVISREGLSRILCLEVKVAGEHLTRFTGDGVIMATPTGSTAYSLSAGGAVVHPQLSAVIVTPICPHASSLRPMVVSSRETVTVSLQAGRGEAKAVVTVDGQENLEIDDSFMVEVTSHDHPLKLVKSSRRSYVATLRENFKFPE